MDAKLTLKKDFKESDIPVLSPDEYLNSLKTK